MGSKSLNHCKRVGVKFYDLYLVKPNDLKETIFTDISFY